MNLRENLNKIHFELSNRFDVQINEKSDLKIGNYVELSINEGNKTVKAFIKKTELNNNNFNWLYFSNPLNENSNKVERTSSVDGFLKDIQDIFEKNRFDSEYIESIK